MMAAICWSESGACAKAGPANAQTNRSALTACFISIARRSRADLACVRVHIRARPVIVHLGVIRIGLLVRRNVGPVVARIAIDLMAARISPCPRRGLEEWITPYSCTQPAFAPGRAHQPAGAVERAGEPFLMVICVVS
jgi:hypothetical protein